MHTFLYTTLCWWIIALALACAFFYQRPTHMPHASNVAALDALTLPPVAEGR